MCRAYSIPLVLWKFHNHGNDNIEMFGHNLCGITALQGNKQLYMLHKISTIGNLNCENGGEHGQQKHTLCVPRARAISSPFKLLLSIL